VRYLDDDLVTEIEKLGGISAIAVSHPHFSTARLRHRWTVADSRRDGPPDRTAHRPAQPPVTHERLTSSHCWSGPLLHDQTEAPTANTGLVRLRLDTVEELIEVRGLYAAAELMRLVGSPAQSSATRMIVLP
jgi:hypothetical protein